MVNSIPTRPVDGTAMITTTLSDALLLDGTICLPAAGAGAVLVQCGRQWLPTMQPITLAAIRYFALATATLMNDRARN